MNGGVHFLVNMLYGLNYYRLELVKEYITLQYELSQHEQQGTPQRDITIIYLQRREEPKQIAEYLYRERERGNTIN